MTTPGVADALSEVIADVLNDPDLLHERMKAFTDLEVMVNFGTASVEHMCQAMAGALDRSAPVDVLYGMQCESFKLALLVGFLAGTHFERRGYKLT